MNSLVAFHPLAEGELDEAAEYYGLENPFIGRAFLDEIERCVQAIWRALAAWLTRHRNPVVAGSRNAFPTR